MTIFLFRFGGTNLATPPSDFWVTCHRVFQVLASWLRSARQCSCSSSGLFWSLNWDSATGIPQPIQWRMIPRFVPTVFIKGSEQSISTSVYNHKRQAGIYWALFGYVTASLVASGIILYQLYVPEELQSICNQSGFGLSTRGFQQALLIWGSNTRIRHSQEEKQCDIWYLSILYFEIFRWSWLEKTIVSLIFPLNFQLIWQIFLGTGQTDAEARRGARSKAKSKPQKNSQADGEATGRGAAFRAFRSTETNRISFRWLGGTSLW